MLDYSYNRGHILISLTASTKGSPAINAMFFEPPISGQ
jgi:hypothetical protein